MAMIGLTNKRVKVIIHGRVQGVFFRQSTFEVASTLLISGYVKNLPNGSVEALFEGDSSNVDKILQWCHKGPSYAIVKDVEIQYESKKDFEYNNFIIK